MVDIEGSYLWRLLFGGGDCFHLKYHDSLWHSFYWLEEGFGRVSDSLNGFGRFLTRFEWVLSLFVIWRFPLRCSDRFGKGCFIDFSGAVIEVEVWRRLVSFEVLSLQKIVHCFHFHRKISENRYFPRKERRVAWLEIERSIMTNQSPQIKLSKTILIQIMV